MRQVKLFIVLSRLFSPGRSLPIANNFSNQVNNLCDGQNTLTIYRSLLDGGKYELKNVQSFFNINSGNDPGDSNYSICAKREQYHQLI